MACLNVLFVAFSFVCAGQEAQPQMRVDDGLRRILVESKEPRWQATVPGLQKGNYIGPAYQEFDPYGRRSVRLAPPIAVPHARGRVSSTAVEQIRTEGAEVEISGDLISIKGGKVEIIRTVTKP